MAQLVKRLDLDLANALAGDPKPLADLFERALAAVADAEPHLDDLFFARRERPQDRLGLLLEIYVDHRFGRRNDLAILDEVAKMRISLCADRRLERDRLLRDLEHLPHLGCGNIHPLGDFLCCRFASELLDQRAQRAIDLIDYLDHVDRDADGPGLVLNRARDRLADPPDRVRR